MSMQLLPAAEANVTRMQSIVSNNNELLKAANETKDYKLKLEYANRILAIIEQTKKTLQPCLPQS